MFFVLFLCLLSLSWAGELEKLIWYALENSPRIKQYEKLLQSFEYRERYVKSLPNPSVFAGLSNLPVNRPYPNSKEPMSAFSIGFSQVYTLPVKRELEAKVAREQKLQTQAGMLLLQKELIRDIKLRYLEWLYTFKKESLLRAIKESVDALESSTRENYRYGRATLSDLLSLKGEKIRVQKLLIEVKQDRERLKNEIDALVGASFELKGEEINLQGPDFESIDLQKSPYLREKYAKLRELEAQLERKRVEHLPDIELMVEYMARPSMSDMFSVRIGFSLPVWKSRREDLMVLEKREEIQASREEIKNMELELKRAISNLRVDYESKREFLKLTQELINQKKEELKALELAYRYSRADFRDLMRLYRELWELELNRLDLELRLKSIPIELEALL
ncbi:MAG: TolC family protein [Hydrogenobacter thermophilus]|uniref:Outer membrane efflux protein n=1 Tax=Hydrogenobacter thermophilus (strain DSM 6534 / IAM 12695 / TK-6) TaxID=608538 RepID=D3DK97_HYDTT|nr:TolC family protein [Hydrogenobacter thermophilus]ADO46168.1 outer membrane efflux protein [Hydrogenobacter thermophilus TK-6]MCS7284113.1 TolC family protein [Hydrogenobacter thermophilus]BAI70249.1 outer membrane efflux protein [Hydrogenobacter thermophilus TK-6]